MSRIGNYKSSFSFSFDIKSNDEYKEMIKDKIKELESIKLKTKDENLKSVIQNKIDVLKNKYVKK